MTFNDVFTFLSKAFFEWKKAQKEEEENLHKKPNPMVSSFQYTPAAMDVAPANLEDEDEEFKNKLVDRMITLQIVNDSEAKSKLKAIGLVFHIKENRLDKPRKSNPALIWSAHNPDCACRCHRDHDRDCKCDCSGIGLPSYDSAKKDISIPSYAIAKEYGRLRYPKIVGISLVLHTPVNKRTWQLDEDNLELLSRDLNKAKRLGLYNIFRRKN